MLTPTLTNVKLQFVTGYTTSKLHSLDQRIIRALKVPYCRKIVQKILFRLVNVESNQLASRNIKNTISCIRAYWEAFSSETNCSNFSKADASCKMDMCAEDREHIAFLYKRLELKDSVTLQDLV